MSERKPQADPVVELIRWHMPGTPVRPSSRLPRPASSVHAGPISQAAPPRVLVTGSLRERSNQRRLTADTTVEVAPGLAAVDPT
jgi:hypothetical protein